MHLLLDLPNPRDKQQSNSQKSSQIISSNHQTMPSYADKSAFLANGLAPFIASPPHTPPPASPSSAATSDPLFSPVAADTPSTPTPAFPTTDPALNTIAADAPAVPASPPDAPSQAICPVCLDPLSPTPPAIRIRTCTHAYHEVCLSRWLDKHNTCPACRGVLFTAAPRAGPRAPPGSMAAAALLPPWRLGSEVGRPASRRWVSEARRPWDGYWGGNGEWVEVRTEMPGPPDDTAPVRRARVGRLGMHRGASEGAGGEGAGGEGARFMMGRRRGPRGSGRDVPEVGDEAGRGG
ncbi:hypothetical protein PMIN02_002340 [Paraphaeosphaeria minitans]